jgi:hypothetical protein
MTGGWKVPDVQAFFCITLFKRAGSFLLVSGKAWMPAYPGMTVWGGCDQQYKERKNEIFETVT